MKRIGIIGTRKRNGANSFLKVEQKFFELYEEGDIIVSGGCSTGGDRFAEVIAKENGIPILIIYPNYKKYGKGAAIIRNGPVAEASDIIVACIISPIDGLTGGLEKVLERKKGGTEDTLRKYVKNKSKIQGIYLV